MGLNGLFDEWGEEANKIALPRVLSPGPPLKFFWQAKTILGAAPPGATRSPNFIVTPRTGYT